MIYKKGKQYSNIMDLENVAGVLRYLTENSEASAVDLRAVIPTYERMKRTLESMGKEGLVNIKFEETPRLKYTYSITEKGRKVAAKLAEIDSILNS